MPSGNVKDVPPPPTTEAEVERSPFRKLLEYLQKVELNGLLSVGCFEAIVMETVLRERRYSWVLLGSQL